MEESSDDDGDESSDEEAELDFETFDTSKLVKDEEDKKYLDSLPELEREAILGERFEKRKAEQDMKIALRDAKYVHTVFVFSFFFIPIPKMIILT
jgi:RNA polymerase-associated protein RTF1